MDIDALVLDRVNVFYGDSHVLHDMSFRLRAGRALALLGRNGVGKTTCISALMGFLPIRSGEIRLFGEPISNLATETIARHGVGLVPQGRRIFPTLTVRENLLVGIRRPGPWARSVWTLAQAFEVFPRLDERQNQVAGSLSGGEQQMLAIGRALMTNPRLLLLDEPSEGLAPQIVNEVNRILLELKRRGLSIVLVEQNIGLALDVADDVVILNTARITFDGTAEAIRTRQEFLSSQLGVC